MPRLQDFTVRFTPRFCELMHDINEDVAAAGLRLLALLVEQGIIKHKVRYFMAHLLESTAHGSCGPHGGRAAVQMRINTVGTHVVLTRFRCPSAVQPQQETDVSQFQHDKGLPHCQIQCLRSPIASCSTSGLKVATPSYRTQQVCLLLVICGPLQDVSGVYMLLAMPSAELRSSAAALVVNLLEEQGREAMTATADRLKVCFQHHSHERQ